MCAVLTAVVGVVVVVGYADVLVVIFSSVVWEWLNRIIGRRDAWQRQKASQITGHIAPRQQVKGVSDITKEWVT